MWWLKKTAPKGSGTIRRCGFVSLLGKVCPCGSELWPCLLFSPTPSVRDPFLMPSGQHGASAMSACTPPFPTMVTMN